SVAPWARLASPAIVIAVEFVRVGLPHAERLPAAHVLAIQVRRRWRDAEVRVRCIARAPPLARCGRHKERDEAKAAEKGFRHCRLNPRECHPERRRPPFNCVYNSAWRRPKDL
ncbi:MAG TPA: hypothetical protein VM890_01495, partial [Longimicrobium sp.]|nr:hypothetical protein [Longimicrobium sp.]